MHVFYGVLIEDDVELLKHVAQACLENEIIWSFKFYRLERTLNPDVDDPNNELTEEEKYTTKKRLLESSIMTLDQMNDRIDELQVFLSGLGFALLTDSVLKNQMQCIDDMWDVDKRAATSEEIAQVLTTIGRVRKKGIMEQFGYPDISLVSMKTETISRWFLIVTSTLASVPEAKDQLFAIPLELEDLDRIRRTQLDLALKLFRMKAKAQLYFWT